MRLTTFTLANYGPFRAHRITFNPAPGRINLLIAPNGAGKSVLRSAFSDLLFGIHPQTEMGFRFGNSGMRLTAEAVAADGTAFVFGRRKGTGKTLVGVDGEPLDPASLAHVVGDTDKELLERLFALDTERLRKGGIDLLASSGDLADALLAAAGGLRRARQLRLALEKQRDALAPERRVTSRPFYQAFNDYGDARKRLDASVLRPDSREQQENELSSLREMRHKQEAIAKMASARMAKLERVHRVAGTLRQHDAASAWLAANPHAPALPSDIGERLSSAAEALRRSELMVERERSALAEATQRAEALVYDAQTLEAGEEIDELVKRSGVAVQAVRDIPKREAEVTQAEQRIADLLRQLGSQLPPARARELIPQSAVLIEARRLFPEHEKLREELARLPGERDAASREITEIEAELERLPPPSDTAALAREVRVIRGNGDPSQRAAEASRTVAEAAAALAAAHAKIPLWGERAARLPAQPVATYERLDATRLDAVAALKSSDTTLAKLREQEVDEQKRLSGIAAAGALPDAAAVGVARAHRDRGWQLIYRRAFTPEPPDVDETEAWTGEVALPLAYERAVARADALADQRTRESDRLAQSAEISRRLAGLRGEIGAVESRHATQAVDLNAALDAWRAALEPLELAPETTLGELRLLLAGRDKVIDAEQVVARARAAQESLASRHTTEAARLAAALGLPPPTDPTQLPGILATAEQRIEEERVADQARVRLRDKLATRRRDEQKIADSMTRAQERMDALVQPWAKVRAGLGRPGDEAPAVTYALLDQFTNLDAETQKALTAHQRIDEMRADIARFKADATSLAVRIAPDLADGDSDTTVEVLRRRLAEQRGRAKQHEELLAHQERAQNSLSAEQTKRLQDEVELRAVLETIGVETVEAAEPLVALAAERARMADTQRRAEAELLEKSDGLNLDALRAEVATVDLDTILSEKETAEAEHDNAWNEVKSLTARITTQENAMKAQAAGTDVLKAEADREAAVAKVGRVLDEALELHLAALILEDALAGIDAAGTSSLLARISTLFSTLTAGAYERVTADDSGDGRAQLSARERAFPDEAKSITALSDGTRDQLFLALRLVAIEDYAAEDAPLPFIGDDILQTFDDERSLATMRALLDASDHVQVILLSHHAHLRTLANALGSERVHFCAIEPCHAAHAA